jgi:ribonuclease T1
MMWTCVAVPSLLRFVAPTMLLALLVTTVPSRAESCSTTAAQLNRRLSTRIGVQELTLALASLNDTANRRLPDRYVTKQQARRLGWHPGADLWRVPALMGKSIGGDNYQNREGRLPAGGRRWREADLDYRGGHRGAKRLLYADDGTRAVTVDHYRSFVPIADCE